MSVTPHVNSTAAESFRLSLGYVWSYFTITGNTTDASSSATTKNPAFKIFIEEGSDSGDPAVIDSDNGFSTLDDDTAPNVVGFLVMVGDAEEFYGPGPELYVHSGDITAVAWTLEGTGDDGVTTSGNLSVTGAFTGLDIDANTNVQKFSLKAFYRKA